MAITNCLNFGNPRKPSVFYQLKEAIAGMGEACRALETPVTGGNVSLYNESPGGAVYPTPVVGMVGLIESIDHITRSTFRDAGDTILLLGESREELGGSEYLAAIHGLVAGAPPACDLAAERSAIDAVLEGIRSGVVASAHDVSDGGLAVAVAECCIAVEGAETGANIDLGDSAATSFRGALFGESQARFVVSSDDPAAVELIAGKHGVAVRRLGTVTTADEGFVVRAYGRTIETDIETLSSAWHDAIPDIMAGPAAVFEPAPAGV